MTVYSFDPLSDSRWPRFLERHPASSIFHTQEWLASLRDTYGYSPIAFTTLGGGQELQNGIVFAEVSSWLTGKRIVSLPFSDHCEPLVEDASKLSGFLRGIEASATERRWKYVEIRPLPETAVQLKQVGFPSGESYAFHAIDLRPNIDNLFKSFHKSCIQRKITRAEREGLRYDAGTSSVFLDHFYSLLLITRRRHQLPPQPRAWFQNLARHFGSKLCIHVVYKEVDPIATILTIQYKNTLVYKYGSSDARFHKFGGMIHLFWKAIQQAKSAGLSSFDLGRSELSNKGLIEYKGHWGAPLQTTSYFRFPATFAENSEDGLRMRLLKSACKHMPDPLLEAFGTILYRHVG